MVRRGKHFLDCLDRDWAAYFFDNWFDFRRWDLFTHQELTAIREDVVSSVVFLEELLSDNSSGEATELLVVLLDSARADLGRLDEYLGSG